MRLTELDVRWIRQMQADPHDTTSVSGQGIAFECPVHRSPCMLAVWLANPILGERAFIQPHERYWQRTGDAFDTLTLTPSVDASRNCKCGKLDCPETGTSHTRCWHGQIANGAIT